MKGGGRNIQEIWECKSKDMLERKIQDILERKNRGIHEQSFWKIIE